MRVSVLALAALLAGCATGTVEVKRQQALLLRPGAEATLRVDCPPGRLVVSAKPKAGSTFVVSESRAEAADVWWVTFANPTDADVREEVSIRLACR